MGFGGDGEDEDGAAMVVGGTKLGGAKDFDLVSFFEELDGWQEA